MNAFKYLEFNSLKVKPEINLKSDPNSIPGSTVNSIKIEM